MDKVQKDSFAQLDLQMISDSLAEQWWEYDTHLADAQISFTGCLLFCGQQNLRKDILYMVPEETAATFPADRFCYVTTTALQGKAPHIRNVNRSAGELMNLVIDAFQRFRDFERNLNEVINNGGSLTQLCKIGSAYLQNPVYIHDNLFAVIAESHHVQGMLDFEYNEKTNRMYIPLWLIDEFKFDDAYRETLTLHKASIWGNDQYPFNIRTLFVNLWDGELYRGRLMINEIATSIQPGHFRAAEMLAHYVILCLHSMEFHRNQRNYNFEEIFVELLTTGKADARDIRTIMGILEWKQTDDYLCMKLQNQSQGNGVRSDSALNSRLSAILNSSVTFRYQQQLYVVVNLTASNLHARALRIELAPLIRDSCMYVGLSNPVSGFSSLNIGFRQADIAMDYITNVDSSDWIVSFSSCALTHMIRQSCSELPPDMMAHPVLTELLAHDEAMGTQYYHTLKVYLQCERSIPMTAAALIIHRTTLTYRLGKIQELTRLNLDDANLRLYLLLSYQLLEQGREKSRN